MYDQTPSKNNHDTKVPERNRASEFLANERTFLAWVRTSVTILSFGFVVAKFSLWLREIGARDGSRTLSAQNISGMWMGVSLILLGGLLSLLAAWRYHVVNRSIEQDQVKPDRSLVALVTLVVVFMAVLMIAFVLLTINHI